MAELNSHDRALVVRAPHPQASRLVYDERATLSEHLARLDALQLADKDAERRWARAKKILITTAISSAVAIFLLAIVPPLMLLGWFGLIASGVIGLVLRYRLAQRDLEDRKLHAARHLLVVLGPELRGDRPFPVRVDFRGYERVMQSSTWGRSSTAAVSGEEPDWLALDLLLGDGTRLAVRASTLVKRKLRSKRKYTKVKDRIVDDLELHFAPPTASALDVDVDAVRQRLSAFGLRPKAVVAHGRGVTVRYRLGPARRLRARGGWTADGLAGLVDGFQLVRYIAFTYRTLVAARRGATVAADV